MGAAGLDRRPCILLLASAILMPRAGSAHADATDVEPLPVIGPAPAFVLTREVGKGMLQRGRGKILFTCSLLSFQGGINVPGYAASKGALASLIITTAAVLAPNAPDPEKLSAYECGFNAFDDARMKFDVRFYLVSILFIIFDLEVAFLFPWAVAFKQVGAFGFWSMMVFLGVLTVGFAYEWKKGALEWD